MTTIQVSIEYKDGTKEHEEYVEMDDLQKLVGKAQAGITTTVGFSLDFGKAKASVSVHLSCDQNEDSIKKAAELSLVKAAEFADYAMQVAYAKLGDGS